MAGGREQLVGLDWGAVAVEPYQLVPLLRVARTMRARLLIADDTGLGKTAEAGIILRWLAQRHQAGRVLIVTRAAPEPQRWQKEMWTKFGRVDSVRKVPSGRTVEELQRITDRRNKVAHESDRRGDGRATITVDEVQDILDQLRSIVEAIDQLF